MHKLVFAFILGGLALAASAEPERAASARVGAIGDLAGTVTVGGHGVATRAVYGTPLLEGSTVMVSSDGRAKVVLAACTVSLRGSQYITVNSKLSCKELQASAQQLMGPYRVAQVGGTVGAGAGGSAAALSPLIGFAAIAGTATVGRISADNNSPSGS